MAMERARRPHDEIFNKFLDGLWNEYDSLVSKGYTGEGFLGSGRRVGEGISHDNGMSLREAREKALKNFEEKERLRKLLGTGGKLGGKPIETKGRRMGDILADVSERVHLEGFFSRDLLLNGEFSFRPLNEG